MTEFKKMPFSKVVKDVTRNYSKIPKTDYLSEGLYPIIDQGKDFICGYTNDPQKVTEKDKPVIIFGDHTRVFKFIDFPIAIGADGVKVLEVDSSLANEEFIYEYLRTINLHNAGYSRHFKYLKEVKIPIPDTIEVQKGIANALQKINALITQREESIELADEFLRNLYLETFSQIDTYEILGEVCSKITDGTHDTPKRLKSGVKFITGKHIRPFFIDYDNSDYVTQEVHDEIYKRCNPEIGDILYTNIGVNLGTAAMNTVKYEFSMKNVALLKLKSEQIKSRYLEHTLNNDLTKRKIIELSGAGGAQKFLSLKQIKQIRIPIPTIDLQNNFSRIVEQVEKIKFNFNISLKELEDLYCSLSHKAFNGELTIIENIEFEGSIKVEPKISATVEVIEQKPPVSTIIEPVKKKEKVTASITHIPFLKTEEDLLSHISRNCSGSHFTFSDIKEAVKGLDWTYDFEELKNLVFSLVRNKQLKQVFADAAYKAGINKADAAYKEITDLSEQIYFKRML